MIITSLYASLLGILLIVLSYNVAGKRRALKIGIGHGESKSLNRAIRVQANFVEYVPFALILLMIFENNHANSWIVHIAGAALVIARVLHAYGLGKTVKVSFGRFAGICLTWFVILGLAGLNLYHFIAAAI
ncbi:MAG: MAPEG family protein [Kangiellaceae bacterium]|nr:MAPEG family protein [Kangiellaceae bacterium]